MTEKLPPSPSFRRKRCGVKKSPSSDGTGGITVGDLSTQSIIGAVTVCPIPARSPARDDGGGGHPYRHFDRSGAEWRNLTPLMTEKPARALSSFRPKRSGVEKSHSTMVHEALRQEISRLRVSSKRQSVFHLSPIPARSHARDDEGAVPEPIKKAPPVGRLCL